MPHPNALWLGAFQGRELKKYCYIIHVMKYFSRYSSILLGQCFGLSCWRPGFNSPVRQFSNLTFSPSSPSPPVIITKQSSLDQQLLKQGSTGVRTSRPVRKSSKFSKSGLSGNRKFSFPDAKLLKIEKRKSIFFAYLYGKIFKIISPDSVQSGRTCPANLGVQSCPVRKLICPVRLSPK